MDKEKLKALLEQAQALYKESYAAFENMPEDTDEDELAEMEQDCDNLSSAISSLEEINL